MITSRIAYTETMSALAMALRLGRLAPRSHHAAKLAPSKRWDQLLITEVSPEIAGLGGDLAELRELRALDALHLATAVTIGGDLVLATWDERLRHGALESGVAVAP